VQRALDELPLLLTAAFDNQSYRERREAIESKLTQRHEQELERVGQAAAARDVAVARMPSGMVLLPMRNGKVLETPSARRSRPRSSSATSRTHAPYTSS